MGARLHGGAPGTTLERRGTPVAYPAMAAGLALFTALIAYHGVREVAAAVSVAGPGLLAVALFHAAPLVANAIGWRCLLTGSDRPPLATMILARWISDSVNGLLPVLQIGGNVVRARLIARQGVPIATAGASVVADITLNVLMQIVFTFLGLVLLVIHFGSRQLVVPVLIGVAIMGSMLAGFYLTQRRGLFGAAAWLLGRITPTLNGTALASEAVVLDDALMRLYRRRAAIATTSAWHLLSWILGAGEVWLGLYFLGHPVTLLTAVLMESLTQAIRTAAFVVPGALGVQEGGYLLVGTIFGLAPQTALALALVKRVRELLLGVPGLVTWQYETAARVVGQGLRREDAVGSREDGGGR